MTDFKNTPNLKDENNGNTVKRYVHQPLTIDHYGIHAQIKPNGKILLSSIGEKIGEEVEYDEIEIPASLVFKLATLLKATRSITFVSVAEAKDLAPVT